jgi:hypothetical protein
MFQLSVEIQEMNLIVTTNLEHLLSFSASKFRFNRNIQANCQLKYLTRQPASQPTNQPTNQSPDNLFSQNSLPIAVDSHVFKNSLLWRQEIKYSLVSQNHTSGPSVQSAGSSPQHYNLILKSTFYNTHNPSALFH